MSAASRVLDTPELVEMILLDLPMRDMFLAKNVSPTNRNVVAGSSKLRKALWLTIGELDHKPLAFLPELKVLADNLMLKEGLSAAAARRRARKRYKKMAQHWSTQPLSMKTSKVKENPVLTCMLRPRENVGHVFHSRNYPDTEIHRKVFANKDALWRDMYAISPPVSEITVYTRAMTKVVCDTTVKCVRNRIGLRIGDIIDAIMDEAGEAEVVLVKVVGRELWQKTAI